MEKLTLRKAKAVLVTGGEKQTLDLTAESPSPALSWTLTDEPDRFRLSFRLPEGSVIESVGAEFGFDFEGKDRLFLNGYQSWTDSREWDLHGKMRGIDHLPRFIVKAFALNGYSDYDFVEYGGEGQLHGFSYAYVRRGKEFILLGSLAEKTGYTLIRFDTERGTVSLQKDCHGRHVQGDYAVFDLAVLTGTEDEVFDRWFALMEIPKPRGGRITGYTSWYNLYQNINQESIEKDLAGFAEQPVKPDVFQIDDGYETFVGDWLSVDPRKFPGGMGSAAEKIRAAGMTPGLWLAPFAAEKKSALVKDHPEWLLRDDKGAPVVAGGNWSGFYGLDIYREEVRAYLKEVFDTVLSKWGYGLVKLDFLYACCVIPRSDKTRAEIMADGMALLRELCGDALILGCGVPLASAFGMVDYCRIGCDVALSWNDVFYMRPLHRERPSTRNTILNTVFRRQLNGRAFWNDPDVFLLRDENLKLKPEEKRLLATVNALFGGVLFTSDNPADYAPETRAFYDSLSSLSPAAFRSAELEKKCVVIRYAVGDEEKEIRVKL